MTKIIIEIVPAPISKSFNLMGDFNKQEIIDNKSIDVSSYMETKTLVGTSFQVGNTCAKVNWQIEGFNYKEKKTFSYFVSSWNVSSFFKLSKKQGLKEYKEHLEQVALAFLKQFNISEESLPELTLKLEQPKFI